MRAKSINEKNQFQRGGDKREKLGIGKMKEKTEWLSQFLYRTEWKINNQRIDVDGDIIIPSGSYEKEIPEFIKFGKCSGSFIWNSGYLQDLQGCPEIVGEDFYVAGNNINNLKGCPSEVGGDFFIGGNPKKFTKEEIQNICNVKGKIRV